MFIFKLLHRPYATLSPLLFSISMSQIYPFSLAFFFLSPASPSPETLLRVCNYGHTNKIVLKEDSSMINQRETLKKQIYFKSLVRIYLISIFSSWNSTKEYCSMCQKHISLILKVVRLFCKVYFEVFKNIQCPKITTEI